MPKKSSNQTGSTFHSFTNSEFTLSALVVAELQVSHFEPLTFTDPHCLLPLATVPLLHFCLSRLISDGFNEIIVYACNRADKIKEFIQEMKYNGQSGATVTVHDGQGSRCIGDIMRDVDSNELLNRCNDFILVFADLLCDTSLRQAFNRHVKRRVASPNSVLTLVYPDPNSPYMCTFPMLDGNRVTLVTHSPDSKVVHFAPSLGPYPSANLDLASEIFTNGPLERVTTIWPSVLDLGVAICSSHIPPLFQDNFDYETLDDLINGILTNEEIIGYIIHIDVLPLHSVALHAGVDLIQLSELTLRLLRRGYLQNLDMFPLRHTLGLQNISKFDPSTAQEQIMPLSEAKGANAGENIKSCSGKSKKKNRQPDSDSKVISQKIQPTQGYHSKTLDAIFPRRILAVGVTTFVDRTAEIAPNARLVGACFIGPGCRISQNCLLVDCIIGPGCKIGHSSQLRRVVAAENVEIGQNVYADVAWLCHHARILDGVRLGRQCFVGPPGSSFCLSKPSIKSTDSSPLACYLDLEQHSLPVCLGPGGRLPPCSVLVAPGPNSIIISEEIGGAKAWASIYQRIRPGRQRHSTLEKSEKLTTTSHDDSSDSETPSLGSRSSSDEALDSGNEKSTLTDVSIWMTQIDRAHIKSQLLTRHNSGNSI